MPIFRFSRFVCDITYQSADCADSEANPQGWFSLNGECFHPLAQLVIAQRIIAAAGQNPPVTLTPEEILAPAHAAELIAVGLPVPEGVV